LVFANGLSTIIKTAAVIAIFEIIIKPVLKLLLLPINLITLGAFRVIINVLGLYLAVFLLADFSVANISTGTISWQGFTIPSINLSGFFAYFATSFSLSLLLNIFNSLLTRKIKV